MARRRASRRFYFFIVGALVTVAAVAIIFAFSSPASMEASAEKPFASEQEVESGAFGSGVSIGSVDVAGMTFGAGNAAVESAFGEKLGGIEFIIAEGEISHTLSGADISASAVMADAIESAKRYSETVSQQDETGLEISPGKRDFPVTITADREAIISHLGTFADDFKKKAVEPKVKARLNDDNRARFSYEEGENGRELDLEAVADMILDKLREGELKADIEPVYISVEPERSVEELKAKIKKRSSYTTRFRYSSSDEVVQNRCFNVQKGAELLNEAVVNPGEKLSFNKRVGLRTEKDGWKLANGISGGKEYTLQAGGGICQVSTTLYNALLCANIEITDRKAHSIPSDYVPKGLDATVDSGGIDLEFRNNTDSPLYIFAFVTNDKESSRYRNMHVVIYGEPLPKGVEYKPRSEIIEETLREDTKYTEDPSLPRGYQVTKVIRHDGYVAEAFLDKYENGKLVESKSIGKDKYRGNNAEIAVGTGDPSSIPPPEGAEPVTPETKAQMGGAAPAEQEKPAQESGEEPKAGSETEE